MCPDICCPSPHKCFVLKGFASELGQPQGSEEEEKEGDFPVVFIFFFFFTSFLALSSILILSLLQQASKTVENATGQAMETEAAE